VRSHWGQFGTLDSAEKPRLEIPGQKVARWLGVGRTISVWSDSRRGQLRKLEILAEQFVRSAV